VGKLRVLGGAMPVFFTGRDNNDITLRDHHFFFFCSDNPLSESDDQNLFAVVRVKLIANNFAEIYDIQVVFFAVR